MGQALYRKYRSKSLSEIIGQEHITAALEQAIKTNRISHAYLFTGPRGIGKTSIARILAYAINDLPYSTDTHMDIIEIDAASNRRIDEIRDIRDKVYIAPTSAKYKVYIIDEVHMLTREAFNALLKTLEEPPAHVIFILATTDAHKLPETIVSRTQRYNFRPVDFDKVADHLQTIVTKEKFSADPEALRLLAEHGEGSFRDSISMLDQVSNHGSKITVEAVRSQLGIPSDEGVLKVLETLPSSNLAAPVVALQELYDAGYRGSAIAEQLSKVLRQQLATGNTTLPSTTVLGLLKQLLNVASARSPERYLEVLLMEMITPEPAVTAAPVHTKTAAPKATATKQSVAPIANQKPTSVPKPAAQKDSSSAPAEMIADEPEPEPTSTPVKTPPTGQMVIDDTSWTAVLSELKKQYNTIYGIVRMAHTDFSEPGRVSLSFAFAFHQKRISDSKNRTIVTDTIELVTGQQVELVCIVSKEPQARPAVSPVKTDEPPVAALQDISSVFGGGELL